jgi:putative serine/threonine protein kinase
MTTIGGIRILGKGNVGLVIKAVAGGRLCALKIRRTDANRETMHDEVRLHMIANGAGVGPLLLGHSDNFMLMEYAAGQTIAEWAAGDMHDAREVARSVLEQCYRLDRAGLDHGELSHIDNHVIVEGTTATIIDFESASTNRKTSNVSAAGQSLFVSGPLADKMNKALKTPGRDAAINVLRTYKRDQTRANFDALVKTLLG